MYGPLASCRNRGKQEENNATKGFSIIGGGHIAAATVNLGYGDKMDHISSGGGASIDMLAGNPLPAVVALEESKELFDNK